MRLSITALAINLPRNLNFAFAFETCGNFEDLPNGNGNRPCAELIYLICVVGGGKAIVPELLAEEEFVVAAAGTAPVLMPVPGAEAAIGIAKTM